MVVIFSLMYKGVLFFHVAFLAFHVGLEEKVFHVFYSAYIYEKWDNDKDSFFFQCLGLHTFCVDSLIGSPLVKSTTALLLLCSAPRFLSCDVRSRSVHIDSEGLTTSQVFSLL